MVPIPPSLSERLLAWYQGHGRRDLPWQHPAAPYPVWISEIMLQQTQVQAVIPYFEKFMAGFPDVHALAAAPLDEVLHVWGGLGYYARARNLHRAAKTVVSDHDGELPRSLDALMALPGIGRSTAAAILALSFGDRHAILDGNVKRVLTRIHAIDGWSGNAPVARELWSLAEQCMSHERPADYTQAIMDLGATVCVRTKPHCEYCPLRAQCDACRHGTQANYPARKQRKPLPLKQTRFLMAGATDGTVLLWRRPPLGIWGGLWSFPAIDAEDDIESWCRGRGLRLAGVVVERKSLTHTFTHFRLQITPLEFAVQNLGRSVMDSDRWLWYNTNEPARIGLATPVSRLLQADQNPED